MVIRFLKVILIGTGVLFLLASHLFASTADLFGMSSRASATAGLVTFKNPDPALVYQNPAYLTQAEETRMTVTWLGVLDFFEPIEGVVLKKTTVGNESATGDVITDYPDLSGLSFGAVIPIRKTFPKIALGTTGFFPFGSVASIGTMENNVPVYANYFNRPKRFSYISGAAIEPFENFSIGLGSNIYLTSGANTNVVLDGSNSSVVLAMDLKPGIAPIVGARYRAGSFHFDAAYHAEVDYAMTLKNQSEVAMMGSSVPVQFIAKTSIFYDPEMISIGVSHLIDETILVGMRWSWKRWSQYKIPMNQLTYVNIVGVEANLPDIDFQDVIVPSIGIEVPWRSTSLRAGYRYEPTHVGKQPTDSNLLDTDVHVASVGLGLAMDSILGILPIPVQLDAHLQYHYLAERQVLKDPSDIGYKEGGYTVGGGLFNYGLSFGTTF